MAGAPLTTSLDLALRGGLALLMLALAALLLRDRRQAAAGWLGAVFAVGVAAFVVRSAPGFDSHASLSTIPILAFSAANNLTFWLFARALFDDGFKPRWPYAAAWLLLAAAGSAEGLGLFPRHGAIDRAVGDFLALEALVFAGLVVVQTIRSWRDDLVEARRRLRVFVVAGSGAVIVATALGDLTGGAPRGLAPLLTVTAIAGVIAASLLRIGGGGGLFDAEPQQQAPRPAIPPDPDDRRLAAALDHAIAVDRIYRQDGLTIGQLAHRLDTPEHRLRRLINRTLGQRNFNAFLNAYRIGETKAALEDPGQDLVPVLTIALDAGFNSLGPFNRAFKAQTGLTPTAYRRAARQPTSSDPARRSSKSA